MHAFAQFLLMLLVIYLLIKLAPFFLAVGGLFFVIATGGLLMFMWRMRQARKRFEQAHEAFVRHHGTEDLSKPGIDSGTVIHVQAETMPNDETKN